MLPSAVTVCSISLDGSPSLQAMSRDAGKPAAKMFKPLFPLNENLTGTARPAFTTLIVGGLSTGWMKSLAMNRTATVNVHVDRLPTASSAVTLTVVTPTGKAVPEVLLVVMIGDA